MRQLNIRIPDELHARLEEFVKESGEKQSDVVRKGIGLAMQEQPAKAFPPPLQMVDLVAWVAERANLPEAVAVKRIAEGRVAIDGRPRYRQEIPQNEMRGPVTLDGEPI